MTGPIAPRGSANRMSISRLALNANQVGVVMFPRLPVYVTGCLCMSEDQGTPSHKMTATATMTP